jgi:hypothetical protein
MFPLSGFSRRFRLLAFVAMAITGSLEQCGLRVFLHDYSRADGIARLLNDDSRL